MEAKGRFDFTAIAEDELSFKQGDILKIIHLDEIWCKAELNGQEGLVPYNFLDMIIPDWFQENATRKSAEKYLNNKQVGEFVIRGCPTSPGNFCISIKYEQGMIHYRLLRDKTGQYFIWQEKFSSLNQLVEYYKTNSISKSRIIYLNVDGVEDKGGPSSTSWGSNILYVKAVSDFIAEDEEELSFHNGDIIEVLDTLNPFWWKGTLRGVSGWFPAHITKPL